MSASPGVFVVALALFPFRVTGDKNFYLDCFTSPDWPRHADVHVLSFTGRAGTVTRLNDTVWLHEMSRPFHTAEFARYGGTRDGLSFYRHQHKAPWELVERSGSLWPVVERVRAARRRDRTTIHFIDNFGPGMRVAASAAGAALTTISTRPLGWPYGAVGGAYVRYSTGSVDRIGASSRACSEALGGAGIPARKLRRARWGVTVPAVPHDRATAARRLLWTGFIPHVGRTEFETALKAARRVVRASGVTVDFVFKPESWREAFRPHSGERLSVGPSTRPFTDYLDRADALVSPLVPGAPLTPPLSWLEAMVRAVPVITNQVAGIEELIADGHDGFVQRGDETFEDTVERALDSDLRRVGARARERVAGDFRLDQAIGDLWNLWMDDL